MNDIKFSADSIAARALNSVVLDPVQTTTRAWRSAELPAVGGIGNARSIARIHSALACGGRIDNLQLLSESGARKALEPQIEGVDDVLMLQLRHGIGFARDLEGFCASPNEHHMWWGRMGRQRCDSRLRTRVARFRTS